MQRIDGSAVRGGEINGSILKPTAIGTICPSCSQKVVFSLTGFSNSGPQFSISASGSCPSCKFIVGFWCLNPNESKSFDGAEIFMSPAPKNYFPNPDEMEGIPGPLRKALISTIDCYNAGIYTAATVSGRRTLEGIFKYLVSDDKKGLPLYKLIETVKKDTDLSAPLNLLSHAIRAGGNLGAHFDMEHEPDENVARQIIELLSYLISYLYVLPAKIKRLETDLEKSEPKEI